MDWLVISYICITLWLFLTVRIYKTAIDLLLFKMPNTKAVLEFRKAHNKYPINTKLKLFVICFIFMPFLIHLAR